MDTPSLHPIPQPQSQASGGPVAAATVVAAAAPASAGVGGELRLSWPRSAQWTAAALLAAVLLLLGVQVFAGRIGAESPEPAPQLLLDLNQASSAELMQLPGVGPALAERIERHRQARGPFRSIEELRQVPGVGPATLERLRGFLCLGDSPAPPPASGSASAKPAMAASQVKPRPAVNTAKKSAASKPVAKSKKEELLAGKVINVNRASLAELQKLPGVGPKISQRIVDERSRKAFASVDDLRRVPGIGAKTLDKLRPYVTVEGTVATAAR